jgi:hypothetical protein
MWWVPHVTKKRQSIVSKLKSKCWERIHNCGIRVPLSIDEANEIDQEKMWVICIIAVGETRLSGPCCGYPEGFKPIMWTSLTHCDLMVVNHALLERSRKQGMHSATTDAPQTCRYGSLVSQSLDLSTMAPSGLFGGMGVGGGGKSST